MGNKVDKMLSQLKEGVNSFVKEQLPVDSLVKKLRGQDCGCTNSGDGDAGDLSAVCVCVVGKSCGCDFQDEKRDGDCCDDLNGMYRVKRKETNEETEVCYVPEAFVPVVPVTSTLTEVCYVPEADVPVVPVTSTLTEVCYVPEADVPVVPVTSTLTEVCYVPEADVPVVPVTSTLTEVCYVPEADVPVVSVTSTSMSLTEQDNVGSAFKPVAMDLKDLCLSVGAHEGNSKLDNSIQKFSMNCTCGASHIEFRCQENHQQRLCTSTIIIDIGIDECQSNHSKSELSRERHFPLEPEEIYLLDVRLLSEDDFGALDFACNVAASEPDAPLRGVCREGLLRQRVRSTAVLKKTVLDPISLCGKRPHSSSIFTIDHQTGVIILNTKIDADSLPSPKLVYTTVLEVNTSDARSSSVTLTLTIQDINDNPPRCNELVHYSSVAENTTALTQVYSLNCTDADYSPSFRNLSYTIVQGNTTLFSVNSSGAIDTLGVLDYELIEKETLLIKVSDDGPYVVPTVTVIVVVTGINDNIPSFSSWQPVIPADSTYYLAENSSVGTTLFIVNATDNDKGIGSDITYSISATS
ncbi:protocadherin Fat 3, partial [Biomphalaria glabrata]